ncbi:DSD1 family PLP-dependent enzyme [Burkholderiaceae bacterium FT117]|uniref:DSD1 family PLP-dependent enzyme n=1 Tax=Zeimonas sediminis TaxID=2944268 RepID=UPI002342EC0D|nr:DSD1 family PLP-dependent enzyme [Zeimonas sediminis]MCM5569359.1 DSD1 family PLP-dependent enzyme [Zeimonas sediminis]
MKIEAAPLQQPAFPPPARPGDPLDAVDTPALVLDLDASDANVAALHRQAAAAGLAVRAHGKAHRCPALALRQVAAGAIGVCVQKVGEAEGFAAAGVRDILVTNELVDPSKCQRLARLAGQPGLRLAACVDDPLQVQRLAEACARADTRLEVLIEIDVGQKRCGVETVEQALAIAAAIQRAAPRLALRGLQAYHGRAQHLRGVAERADAIARAAGVAGEFRAALERGGFAIREISGGGTGSFPNEAGAGIWTEIQAGSYALMDLDYRANAADPAAPQLRQALGVMTAVISRRASHAVLDGGLKSFAVDSGLPAMRDPRWRVVSLSDEHTVVEPLAGAQPLELGQRLILDPGHCDPTVNLHDWIVGYRGDRVEAVWPILPRSASR